MSAQARPSFWREAFTLLGSNTPRVAGHVLVFGLIADVAKGSIQEILERGIAFVEAPPQSAGKRLHPYADSRTRPGGVLLRPGA